MEGPVSSISNYVDEEKALKSLLEAFGSLFSLEQIASAYCKAGRDADLAGQILSNKQESTSASSICESDAETRYAESSLSLATDPSGKSFHGNGKLRDLKKKSRAVSAGSVSSFLGKDYVKPAPKVNGCYTSTKSLILNESVFPMSELWGEANEKNPAKINDPIHLEMEDFLFKMLGDGFQLERDMIRQVLDKCGYDMKKSMDKLLDLSAVTLEEKKKYSDKSTEMSINACPSSEELSCKKGLQSLNSSGGTAKVSGINGENLPQQIKQRDIKKEVLVALFGAADRSEELSRETARAVRTSRVLGKPVNKPLRDIDVKFKTKDVSVNAQEDIDNDAGDDEEDDYQLLRKAVKEYRTTMKEYYKAAVDAFAMGDYDRADKLMKQGHFFHQKACETDEESSRKIFETKHRDTQNEMLLELHEHGAKEAIRLLKFHLSSLSGIPSIKYLKVIIETNGEDVTKGARRRLVKKLLERDSISWTEDQDAGSILVRLDNIDPNSLSFAKK